MSIFITEGTSLAISLNFEVITCYKCSVPFAVPDKMRYELLKTHNTFYCPHGHAQSYCGETTEQKLKRQLEQKDKELVQKNCEKIQLEGQLLKAERKLKRVSKGVCPCCNRTFDDLARHMKTKHPDVVKKQTS